MTAIQQTREQQQQQQQPVRQENGDYRTWSPAVDIYETKDSYVLQADMPGVNKQGLEITVEGTTLVLAGRRNPQGGGKAGDESQIEYRRVFELDPMIDTTEVKARIEQGVVTVDLPKAEKVKPRKIKIGE